MRSANPQVTPSVLPVANGSCRAVAPHERRVDVRGREHAGGEVDADRRVAARGEVAAQVAGAAREVEHERRRRRGRARRRCAGASRLSRPSEMMRFMRS